MSRAARKTQPECEQIRFSHVTEPVIPGYTITNLSEADIQQLHQGIVPSWIIQTTDFWLRPNPKPSDVPAFELRPHDKIA